MVCREKIWLMNIQGEWIRVRDGRFNALIYRKLLHSQRSSAEAFERLISLYKHPR